MTLPALYAMAKRGVQRPVIEGLGAAGLAKDARVIVERPFGRNWASARKLNAIAQAVFRGSPF
jgi:glucose-6-phosphate 1-dehydrogenase